MLVMLRVLIIEDLPVNMLLTVAILERAGHQALEAASHAAVGQRPQHPGARAD